MVERREGSLARRQTSIHEQANKLARYHDGMAGKPVQEGERITTVDGITCYYVCFWKYSVRGGLVRGFGPGKVSFRGFVAKRVGLGRLTAVRTILSYGTLKDCVR